MRMKRKGIHSLIAALLALTGLGACTSDTGLAPASTDCGKIEVAFSGTAPTRNTTDETETESGDQSTGTTTTISKEEANKFLIQVFRSGELIRGPQPLGEMNMTFPVGQGYTVYAESCTEANAENAPDNWGQKRFTGTSAEFGISVGPATKVSVPMSVVNAAMCVIVMPSMSEYFDNITVTLTGAEAARNLEWTEENAGKPEADGTTIKDNGKVAYFNVAAEEIRTVNYTINASGNGKTLTKNGTIDLTRAKNRRLQLIYDAKAFALNVDVDQEDLFTHTNIVLDQDNLTEDDGKTDADGTNENFKEDNSGVVDYDQYNQ